MKGVLLRAISGEGWGLAWLIQGELFSPEVRVGQRKAHFLHPSSFHPCCSLHPQPFSLISSEVSPHRPQPWHLQASGTSAQSFMIAPSLPTPVTYAPSAPPDGRVPVRES